MHIMKAAQRLSNSVLADAPDSKQHAATLIALINELQGSNISHRETHRLVFRRQQIYAGLLPLLQRMHRLYPETPVEYEQDNVGNLVLTIGLCPYNIQPMHIQTLLSRAATLLEEYIDKLPKDASGCAVCGVHSGSLCEVDCTRQNAALLIAAIKAELQA